jgi:peptidoglycan/LPS O-acetylase OafA/YrhL
LTPTKGLKRRIPSLDGLRGISIWAVLLAHASAHFIGTPLHLPFIRMVLATFAYFGVTVFFVISGFLITFLLLKERARSGSVSIGGFYSRRAIRILPVFLLFTGVVIAFGHPTLVQETYSFTFTTSYFFEQAYRPLQQLWSLSVEEQFYLVWPLLMLRGTLTAQRCCWSAMVVCPLLRIALKYAGYHQYSHVAPAILDSIAAGCLLAFHHEEARSFAKKYLVSNRAFLTLSLGTVVFAEVVYRLDFIVLWGLIPCLVTLVIAAAIERKDWLLNTGPLAWSGLLSYSLYLWQQPFLVFDGPWNYLSVRLPLTFAAAFLSYRFIEKPVLSLFSSESRSKHDRPALPNAVPET